MINKALRHIAPSKKIKKKRLNIIIPASGIPRKLKSKGPKSLLKICQEMTLLEIQYRNLPSFDSYDVVDIIVTTGFEYEKIRKNFRGMFNIRFVFNPLYDKTNICYSIGLALENIYPGDILVIYGDILFSKNLLKGIHKNKTSKLLIDKNNMIKGHKIGVGIEDGLINNMAYSLSNKFGGIVFFTKKEVEMLEKIIFEYERTKLWFLHEVIIEIINNGGKFYPFEPSEGKLMEIENGNDIKRVRREF